MDENNLYKALISHAAKDDALAAKKQTPDIARQRNALLRKIQKILKEIKGAVSAPIGA